jgi:dTDP-4-dehydrorhamnose reductase
MERPSKLAWITGAGGLIGNYLVQTALKSGSAGIWPAGPALVETRRQDASAPGLVVRALTRSDFDLLDFAAVRREFQKNRPQLVIHCAAVTSVADAQKNPDLARRLNVEVTRLLAELAAEIPFVFFSTDLVFDGRKGNYLEADAPNPLHLYGETKAVAEEMVLRNARHLVVRTSINGGLSPSGDRAFNEQLRRALQQAGQGMKLFTDEFRSPIPAVETARAVWELAGKNGRGIYHVAGAERLSRWQIGQLLANRWPELRAKIEPASARDFPGPPRAPDTSLDISKAQRILTKPLPGLGEWLAANPNEPF